MRPLCSICKQKPCAINYHKAGKVFYRQKCSICLKQKGGKKGWPKWWSAGYRAKKSCDKCGHKSKYKHQFDVFHIDGNLNNVSYSNLKTVCANCQRVLHLEGVVWKQGDLVPDF